ncbi:Pyrroline-5-carboxylate reductase, partial [Diplodia seriata]
GNMGGAVLDGLLDSVFPNGEAASQPKPESRVSKFIAYTQSARSAQRLQEKYSSRHASRVYVIQSRIIDAIGEADVVVLGFKPYMAQDVLLAPGVREALRGKLVISMLAGLSSGEVLGLCASGETSPIVTKAVPNMAARCRQSMTILELPDSGSIPPREAELTEWIFSQVGSVKWLASGLVNAGSMLMTACLATLSIPLEGLLDGSVAEGIRRADAMEIAVQGINGLGAMLGTGMHPAALRESISSPRGCTIQSLLTVEKAATRAVFAQALIDGTRHLQPAGDGKR